MPRDALEQLVRPSIDYLEGQLMPSGNLASSPDSIGRDRLVQWCHGAPGAVTLFAMAYKVCLTITCCVLAFVIQL